MTYQEIAKELGLTKMYVWQIEKKALRKLRFRFAKLGITKDDLRLFNRRSLISPLSEINKLKEGKP